MNETEPNERTQTEKWIQTIEKFENESAESQYTDTDRAWEILIGIKRWLISLTEP